MTRGPGTLPSRVLERAVATAQGAAYVGFGLWSLAGRRHYRKVHELSGDAWVLNAHGIWMLLVGSALLDVARQDDTARGQARLLALGSAAGLAANDAASALTVGVAPIYSTRDLPFEAALATFWTWAWRRQARRR